MLLAKAVLEQKGKYYCNENTYDVVKMGLKILYTEKNHGPKTCDQV